jgi:hypothetical protein
MQAEYTIIVGETGNEVGHPRLIEISAPHQAAADDAAASAAKRHCAAYKGDGWWIVKRDGETVAKGGRFNY